MFPCWRYHKDKEKTDKNLFRGFENPLPDYGARIFQSEDELKEAGEGWFDSPAKLSVKEAEDLADSVDLYPSLDEELGKTKKKAKK